MSQPGYQSSSNQKIFQQSQVSQQQQQFFQQNVQQNQAYQQQLQPQQDGFFQFFQSAGQQQPQQQQQPFEQSNAFQKAMQKSDEEANSSANVIYQSQMIQGKQPVQQLSQLQLAIDEDDEMENENQTNIKLAQQEKTQDLDLFSQFLQPYNYNEVNLANQENKIASQQQLQQSNENNVDQFNQFFIQPNQAVLQKSNNQNTTQNNNQDQSQQSYQDPFSQFFQNNNSDQGGPTVLVNNPNLQVQTNYNSLNNNFSQQDQQSQPQSKNPFIQAQGNYYEPTVQFNNLAQTAIAVNMNNQVNLNATVNPNDNNSDNFNNFFTQAAIQVQPQAVQQEKTILATNQQQQGNIQINLNINQDLPFQPNPMNVNQQQNNPFDNFFYQPQNVQNLQNNNEQNAQQNFFLQQTFFQQQNLQNSQQNPFQQYNPQNQQQNPFQQQNPQNQQQNFFQQQNPQQNFVQQENLQNNVQNEALELIIEPYETKALTQFYKVTKEGIKLGRHSINQMVVLEESVSRYHGEILYDQVQKKFMIKDKGSTTGTFIKIYPYMLLNLNQIIEIGSNQFKVTDIKIDCVKLLIVDGPSKGFLYNLPFNEQTTEHSIGRKEKANSIVFSDDQHLSQTHAKITKVYDKFQIEDLGALNGTWLRLSEEQEESVPYELKDKTIFRIGTSATYIVRENRNAPINVEDQEKCVICVKEAKNVILKPCKHNSTCMSCTKQLFAKNCALCPICRAQIQQFEQFYKS